MNADDIGQIIYSDSNSIKHNISEVWQGGVTPILLWPKVHHYEITNVQIHYSIQRDEQPYIAANGSASDYATATGDITAYKQDNTIDRSRSKTNEPLIPIRFDSSNTYTHNGQSYQLFYSDEYKVYGYNLYDHEFLTTTCVPVTWGYKNATAVLSVCRGINIESTTEEWEDSRFYLQSLSEHDTIPSDGGTVYIQSILEQDSKIRHTWTSGYSYPTDNGGHRDVIVQPLTFTVKDSDENEILATWDNYEEAMKIEFPPNDNLDFESKVFTITATYDDNWSSSLQMTQSGGNFVFGDVVIDTFYYATFDNENQLLHGDIIPASGNMSGSGLLPHICRFHQSYGIGNYSWTLTGSANSSSGVVTLSDSRVERTYTINYANATNQYNGAVKLQSKFDNTDEQEDIEKGWTIESSVTLTITDEDDNSDSESAYVYQQANAVSSTDGPSYTKDYYLKLYTYPALDEIDTNPSASISSNGGKFLITAYWQTAYKKTSVWTSGYNDESEILNPANEYDCNTFTLTGTGATKDGAYITFTTNDGDNIREFTISDTTHGSASITIIQQMADVEYGYPEILVFKYYENDGYIPVTGGNVYPFLLTFTQSRSRLGRSLDPVTGAIPSNNNYTSGTASDNSRFTVEYDGNYVELSGQVSIPARTEIENRPNETVDVTTAYARVTCNGKTSDWKDVDIQQECNYLIRDEDVYDSYSISYTIQSPKDGDVPPRNGIATVSGQKNYKNYKRYASAPNTDVVTDLSSVSKLPISIAFTLVSGTNINPNYNNQTGEISFGENQTLDIVQYSLKGSCDNKESESIGITIAAGYYTYGLLENLSLVYRVENDTDFEPPKKYNISAEGNWNSNPLVPSVQYSQQYGWNGRISGAGTTTTGASLSFSGTVIDGNKTTFDTSTGGIKTKSLGTTETNDVTTLVSGIEVTVSLNGTSANITCNNVVQQVNKPETYGTPSITISLESNSVNALEHDLDFSVTCSRNVTYTSHETGLEDIDSSLLTYNENYTWLNFNSSFTQIHVDENLNITSRTATITVSYNGVSEPATLTQAAATYVFYGSQDSYTLSHTQNQFTLHLTSSVNNKLREISRDNITFGTNSNWLTLNSIDNVDTDYSIVIDCAANTSSNSRDTTITARQPGSNYTFTWNITQNGVPIPTISISPSSDYNSFTVVSNYPWTVDLSAPTYNFIQEREDSNIYSNDYISVSPNSGQATEGTVLTITNDLPDHKVAKLIVSTIGNNSVSTYAMVVPEFTMQITNNVNNETGRCITDSTQKSIKLIDTNYPTITWTGIPNPATWYSVNNANKEQINVTANDSTNSRESNNIKATGSANITVWNKTFTGSSTSRYIKIVQSGIDSISINETQWTYTSETQKTFTVTVTNPWTCTFDDTHFRIEINGDPITTDSNISITGEVSMRVTILEDLGYQQLNINLTCGNASTSLLVAKG